jgi:signal transduction histidine kinase
VERHIDTVIEGLVPLMLTGQLDLIHENLGELRKKNAEWTFILLTNEKGQQLYPPLLDAPAGSAAGAGIHVLEKDIRFMGRNLGRLTVHVDYAARLEQLRAQHRQLTILLVAIIGLLAMTWILALETTVVGPLHHLSVAAEALAQHRFDTPLPPQRGDEVGQLVASFAVMRDSLRQYHADLMREIAEHKQAEEEKNALNANLERRVAERTAALEQAFKELEAFSYSVSHDLRAPLRAINGFSKLILENEADMLSPDGRSMLDRIAVNAAKLGQLIDDILEYSRSGRVTMVASEVNLGALVARVVAELSADYPQAQVEIGALPSVTGDPIMLGQVMQNLIGNALKFSSRRELPCIEIGMADIAGERTFFVRDNGAGFDMRYAGKLFGMFQRMHSEQQFPGTGVGLAIVKRLVERHDGHIWAESEPGKGTVIYFTLGKPAH